jgi:hypothetical protein
MSNISDLSRLKKPGSKYSFNLSEVQKRGVAYVRAAVLGTPSQPSATPTIPSVVVPAGSGATTHVPTELRVGTRVGNTVSPTQTVVVPQVGIQTDIPTRKLVTARARNISGFPTQTVTARRTGNETNSLMPTAIEAQSSGMANFPTTTVKSHIARTNLLASQWSKGTYGFGHRYKTSRTEEFYLGWNWKKCTPTGQLLPNCSLIPELC